VSVGSIVIPAHNEASVIVRTLEPLAPLIERGLELIVSANGCTDDTAARARSIPGVVVTNISRPSKSEALNAADAVAASFPRLYLDADITITAEAVLAVFERLAVGDVLAARPVFQYDVTGADRLVAAYYRARGRIPAMHEHLWGAGAYALSEAGHRQLVSFPRFVADDLYVDELFEQSEIDIVATDPVQVRCPRTWQALLSTLRRVQGGKAQLAEMQQIRKVGGVSSLLAGVRGPRSLWDAAVYLAFTFFARMSARRERANWHRDETTRLAVGVSDPRSCHDNSNTAIGMESRQMRPGS
jgi:glycosyltransferase involved in cell wall biosynthesis